jgi:hypothetical protein
VTVLHAAANAPSVLVGTGRVRANIPQPPTGCCRTAVEIELDRVADIEADPAMVANRLQGALRQEFSATFVGR